MAFHENWNGRFIREKDDDALELWNGGHMQFSADAFHQELVESLDAPDMTLAGRSAAGSPGQLVLRHGRHRWG